MKRGKIQEVTAILCGDIHLREDTPICRTDDFQKAQWKKLNFIKELQAKYNCPVYHSGDLFNHWKPSPFLLSQTIKYLPKQFYTIYGNHDLPQHNLELAYKCGINTLEEAGKLQVINNNHWGVETPAVSLFITDINSKVLIWHTMVYQGKKPWPGCTDPMAIKLLRKYSDIDLILTGHNHKTFTETHEGRLIVNPGGMTRQEADETLREPCIFLWYAKTNTVEKILLPFEREVISNEHIQRKVERDERIEAFVTRLDNDFIANISFEDNLEQLIKINKVEQPIQDIVYKAIDK